MKRLILTSCLCVLFAASFALADWDPGDPYKMHYPQLPDPYGWDVFAGFDPVFGVQKVLADDWHCTETGPVKDVHLWGSWREDYEGEIVAIHVSIHDNIAKDEDPEMPWSHPGDLLWERDFFAGEFTYRQYGSGEQGWYNPNTGEYYWPDHYSFHQINIENIPDPFIQYECRIYWLDITVAVQGLPNGHEPEWGWKTSLDHFEDDAVWSDLESGGLWWEELRDPIGESLDLAFVITPEPATIALLGLGALSLIRRKRR